MKKIGGRLLFLEEKDIERFLKEYLMIENFKNIKINIEPSAMGGFDVMFEMQF